MKYITDYDRCPIAGQPFAYTYAALVYSGPDTVLETGHIYATKAEAMGVAKAWVATQETLVMSEQPVVAPVVLTPPLGSNVKAAVRRLVTVAVVALVVLPLMALVSVYILLDATTHDSEEQAVQKDPAMVFLQDIARRVAEEKAARETMTRTVSTTKTSEPVQVEVSELSDEQTPKEVPALGRARPWRSPPS